MSFTLFIFPSLETLPDLVAAHPPAPRRRQTAIAPQEPLCGPPLWRESSGAGKVLHRLRMQTTATRRSRPIPPGSMIKTFRNAAKTRQMDYNQGVAAQQKQVEAMSHGI
ncbi:MAG TPA: hypothetical protein PLC55_13170 [Zoogloea sp.]|nr:hypothetical protein [Zoogloea sp.]